MSDPELGIAPNSSAGIGASRQLSHKVADYVRQQILSRDLQAGEYLRTEPLAKELKVSATPVREALMTLQSEGSVRWEPRRGYRVAGIREQDVDDLFQVQAYIAGELAARAATQLDAETLDTLRTLQESLMTAVGRSDLDSVDELNWKIHRLINKASDSQRLATFLKLTVQYLPIRFFGAVPGWPEASHDHVAILDALAARDPEAARTAMASHVVHVGQLVLAHQKSRVSSPA